MEPIPRPLLPIVVDVASIALLAWLVGSLVYELGRSAGRAAAHRDAELWDLDRRLHDVEGEVVPMSRIDGDRGQDERGIATVLNRRLVDHL